MNNLLDLADHRTRNPVRASQGKQYRQKNCLYPEVSWSGSHGASGSPSLAPAGSGWSPWKGLCPEIVAKGLMVEKNKPYISFSRTSVITNNMFSVELAW